MLCDEKIKNDSGYSAILVARYINKITELHMTYDNLFYQPMDKRHQRKIQQIQNTKARLPEFKQTLEQLLAKHDPITPDVQATIDQLKCTIRDIETNAIEIDYLVAVFPFLKEEQRARDAHAKRVAADPKAYEGKDDPILKRELDDICSRYRQVFWSDSNPAETNKNKLALSEDTQKHEDRQCTYRRINHLREFLRQQQGKSRVLVLPDVVEAVRKEMIKEHIDPESALPRTVRRILKKLNQSITKTYHSCGGRLRLKKPRFTWSKFYECAVNITVHLNRSYVPVNIPVEREKMVCALFERAEPEFIKIRHLVKKGRKNFLSYVSLPFVKLS